MRIIVDPIITTDEAKAMEGSYIPSDYYKRIIKEDADVYWNDNGQQRLLMHFRKKTIPGDMLKNAITVFKKDASKASSLRGVAGGVADPSKMSPNIDHVLSEGKFKTKVVFKDGKVSDYYVSNKVNSTIAGYFDKPKVLDKHEVLSKGMVPCRTTIFTEKNTEAWASVLPMLKLVNKYYKEFEPATHTAQHKLASLTPNFQIADTAFSTLTVNLNWRTAVHVDAGDFKNGYSVIMVAEEGKFKGGYLGFPRFGMCVDVRHGDFLLMDPHQHHANTEIIPVTEDYTRLSFVVYYRENMQKCAMQPVPSQEGGGKIKRRTGLISEPNLTLTPAVFPKRDLSLNVYIRPDTTDIKVIKEVLQDNVYEKKFKIDGTDNWLDLGGNIGTFALLALSRGAAVVTCEPEKENLHILSKNLNHNFPGGKWNIVPAAITVDTKSSLDLYLCKGEYNKYRHTIFPKRGRSTVKVQNVNIHKLLTDGAFNAIKMDIEGAEIPILEHLTEQDYVKYGIKKLVFEYSFDVDDSIPRFMSIIKKLSKVFSMVHYTKVKPDELHYTYFPAMTIVYCTR